MQRSKASRCQRCRSCYACFFVICMTLTNALDYAVCVTGQSRTLKYPIVYENLQQKLFGSLPNASRVELFFVFPRVPLSNATESFFQRFPSSTIIYHDDIPYIDTCNRTLAAHAENFQQQWLKVRACFHAILAREESTTPYDFIIRVRGDLFFFSPAFNWLTPRSDVIQVGEILWSSCSQQAPANDHFAYIPRKFASIYSSAASILKNCSVSTDLILQTSCHYCDNVFQECYLSTHLALNGVPYTGCYRTYDSFAAGFYAKQGDQTRNQSIWTVTRDGGNGEIMDKQKIKRLENLRIPAAPLAICP
jgi:hypothetical protein